MRHRTDQLRAAFERLNCPPLPCTASAGPVKPKAPSSSTRSGKYPASDAVGVGQNEQPFPNVRRARFSRREQACLDAVAHALKLSGDVPKSQGQMAFDVFKEDPSRADFPHDPRDLRPQMSGVGFTAAKSGLAEGLAGITGSDDMNAAAPRSAVEGSQIVPYRRRSQGLVAHPRHESGRCMSFPLDVTHSAISGLGDMQAEVEAAVACAEGEAAQVAVRVSVGMNSHKARSLFRSLGRRSD